uniref:RNA-binding protein 48 n=1 Tax=Rhinopithecus bieti TaxID=61621 RepID=A0A2K6MFQ7_RHIBE
MASSSGELGNLFDHQVWRAACNTWAKYGEGGWPGAVKYLLIQGGPAVGAMKEIVERFTLYGANEQYNALDEYPPEDFTEVYLIKFINLKSARRAKRKMDEQSFLSGLLHVCYAPEFVTKAYVVRTTENKDHYMTKKLVTEHKDTENFRQDFHSEMSGFCTAAVNTSVGNSNPYLPYSRELPLCYFSSKCMCSSRGHVDRASNSSKDGRNHGKTMGHYNHNDSLQKTQINTFKNSVAYPGAQKAITPSEAVDRFMPRITQLQEHKRRREDDHKLGAFLETSSSSNEVMTGPLLPDVSKVDMHDDSLNTATNLIWNKLKQPPRDKPEDVPASHPLKQRRRIHSASSKLVFSKKKKKKKKNTFYKKILACSIFN